MARIRRPLRHPVHRLALLISLERTLRRCRSSLFGRNAALTEQRPPKATCALNWRVAGYRVLREGEIPEVDRAGSR